MNSVTDNKVSLGYKQIGQELKVVTSSLKDIVIRTLCDGI